MGAYRRFRRGGQAFALLAIFLLAACTNALEDGSPLGPGNSTVRITPNPGKVAKGGTVTFSTQGGVSPFSWTISTTSIGTIGVSSGTFTAGTVAGTATVTVTDAVGDTATATVEVLPDLLTVSPGSTVADTAGSVTFTVTGGSGTFLFSIANDDPTSTFTTPTLTAGAASVTVVFTIPTSAQGNQTFTLTVRDTQDGDTGSAKLTLIAS